MSDMYGAAIGVSQASQDASREAIGTAQALKALKEIDMMPTEIAERQARTRGYNATADATETSVAEEKRWTELVRKSLSGDPAAAQQVMSTAGTNPNVTAQQGPAANLYRWARLAEEAGMPKRAADLLKDATTIDSHQATAANARSNQLLHQLQARRAQIEQIGGLAQAALDNPTQYNALRLQAAGMGMDVSQLPESFEAAAPVLKSIVARSMTAKDQLELQIKTTDEARKKTRGETQNRLDGARIGVLGQRSRLLTEQIRLKSKALGPDDPRVLADRAALRANRDARTDLINAKLYPPAPAPQLRELGRVYTLPMGRLQWTKDGWVEAPQAAQAASAARVTQDSSDDLDEDE